MTIILQFFNIAKTFQLFIAGEGRHEALGLIDNIHPGIIEGKNALLLLLILCIFCTKKVDSKLLNKARV